MPQLKWRPKYIHFTIGVLLSLSPVFLKYYIVHNNFPDDDYGSGADVFVWIFYCAIIFVVYLMFEILSFIFIGNIDKRWKTISILSSLLIWVLSMFLLSRYV